MPGRILSLTVYRVVLVSLLLVYQLLALLADFPAMPFQSVVLVVLVVSLLSCFYLWFLRNYDRRREQLIGFIFIQFFFDTLLVSILVLFTGGESSHLRIAYLMIIVLSALFLDKISIYVMMVLSLGFYFLAVNLHTLLFVERFPYGSDFLLSGYPIIMGQTLLCLVTALLSGFMQSAYRASRRTVQDQEARIRSLREIRDKIVESLPSGLMTCEDDGRISFINKMGVKILQRSLDSLKGTSVWALFDLDPPLADDPQHLSRVERRISVAGTKRSFGISFRPLEMESGRHGIMVVFQDLTKIRLLEAHKLLADKMAAIGKMAAGVAHEIRNPLAAISGSIQVLKEVLPEDPTALELADIVHTETRRLDDIISQFLAYARPGSPPFFETLDLVSCVTAFLQLVEHDAQMKDLVVDLDFPNEKCMIMGDQGRLQQVFWNLLRNSYQACKTAPRVEMGCQLQEEEVIFRITDNGIGMTEEQLKDLFTPFQSFSNTGTGLGMSIVYDIIEMHHGKIDVRSKPGVGTTVYLTFPKIEE